MKRTPRGRLLQNGGYEREHARLTSYSDDRRKTSSQIGALRAKRNRKQYDTLSDDHDERKTERLKAPSHSTT